MHLVINDTEWNQCLEETVTHRMPTQLRWTFAIICIFCSPTDVPQLWKTFKDAMSEDFQRTRPTEQAYQVALQEIQNIFKQHGKTCKNFSLPDPVQQTQPYYEQEERLHGKDAYENLNQMQKAIADEILRSVRNKAHNCYYLDGPKGSGKTYLYKTLCHILRGEGRIVLPVAWTGITAKLLTRTDSEFTF